MKRQSYFLTSLIICSLLIASCSPLIGNGPFPTQPESFPMPDKQATLAPTATAAAGEATLVFQDDFSSSNDRWYVEDSGDYFIGPDKGMFRIFVRPASMLAWSSPGVDLDVTSIEADVLFSSDQPADAALFCRMTAGPDYHNYYGMYATSDGSYAILRVTNGNEEKLVDWTSFQDGVFQSGKGGKNHLRGVCEGDRIALYVNGHLTAEVHDSTFTHGDAGILVGSWDSGSAEAEFDNFALYSTEISPSTSETPTTLQSRLNRGIIALIAMMETSMFGVS
jgi:hypothetical protein